MVRDVNSSKKDFYISDKVKIRGNVGPLLNETGDLAKQDNEKAKVLNACFASVFSSKTGWPSRIPGPRDGGKGWSKAGVSWWKGIRSWNT